MDEKSFFYVQGGQKRIAHMTWYRGTKCHFVPTKEDLKHADAVSSYILYGWMPPKPFISRDHLITTFGSCFANEVTNYLARKGYRVAAKDLRRRDSHVIRFGAGMVNTYAILQQFEWAYDNKEFSKDLWIGSRGEIASYEDSIRENTKYIFNKTDVFIITLGLSEVWYNKETGEVYWRAVPRSHYDPSIHGFRKVSVQENYANLERIYLYVRNHRPNAALIFTLSPVPLVATFRQVSCVTANSVSKASLRVAVDDLCEKYGGDDKLFYFPSYEIVKDYFVDPYTEDNRHVAPHVMRTIMKEFSKNFLLDYAETSAELAYERGGRTGG